MRIGILNGPNINRLGKRKARYGTKTLPDITADVDATAQQLGIEVTHFQSNYEGALVEWLHENGENIDAVVLNPAGLTPFGRPLLDALDDVEVPLALVHITQLYKHYGMHADDIFREKADVYVCGLGWRSYSICVDRLHQMYFEQGAVESSPEGGAA